MITQVKPYLRVNIHISSNRCQQLAILNKQNIEADIKSFIRQHNLKSKAFAFIQQAINKELKKIANKTCKNNSNIPMRLSFNCKKSIQFNNDIIAPLHKTPQKPSNFTIQYQQKNRSILTDITEYELSKNKKQKKIKYSNDKMPNFGMIDLQREVQRQMKKLVEEKNKLIKEQKYNANKRYKQDINKGHKIQNKQIAQKQKNKEIIAQKQRNKQMISQKQRNKQIAQKQKKLNRENIKSTQQHKAQKNRVKKVQDKQERSCRHSQNQLREELIANERTKYYLGLYNRLTKNNPSGIERIHPDYINFSQLQEQQLNLLHDLFVKTTEEEVQKLDLQGFIKCLSQII